MTTQSRVHIHVASLVRTCEIKKQNPTKKTPRPIKVNQIFYPPPQIHHIPSTHFMEECLKEFQQKKPLKFSYTEIHYTTCTFYKTVYKTINTVHIKIYGLILQDPSCRFPDSSSTTLVSPDVLFVAFVEHSTGAFLNCWLNRALKLW